MSQLVSHPVDPFICMVIFTDSTGWSQWFRGTLDHTKPGHRGFYYDVCTQIKVAHGMDDERMDMHIGLLDSFDYLTGNWEGKVDGRPCRPDTFLFTYFEPLTSDPTYCGHWESLNSEESMDQMYLGMTHKIINIKIDEPIDGLMRAQNDRCCLPDTEKWAFYEPNEDAVVYVDFPEVPDELEAAMLLVGLKVNPKRKADAEPEDAPEAKKPRIEVL